MPSAPLPANEKQRLEALERYDILDSLPETEYDDLATLAASICGVPISVVSLIDSDRQWFKARYGMDIPQIPRSISLCAYAIGSDEVMEIPNATKDPRFVDNALVTGDFGLRFYAGAPLITPDNYRLGTLCVVDRVPRNLTSEQKHALEALARQVVSQLELRRALKRAQVADAEKAEALAELKASNAVLERFVEHAPAAIAMLDSSWRYVAVSQRFMQSMNLPQSVIKGCDHFKTCSFWPRSWRTAFELALQGEVQRGQGEVLQPDGRSEMFVDWEIHPWQGANEKSEGIIILIDDVTPVRRIEKLKSEFVSVVSHELRTPLTSIRGALGLLGGGVAGALPERAQQMIHIAHKNAERLVLLINDILDIEKIESGQMKFDLATLDLAQLLQNTVAANEHYAQTFDVSIKATLPAEELPVEGDETRLAQVMANLLSNAAKFTPGGGEVVVRTQLLNSASAQQAGAKVEARSLTEWVRVDVFDGGDGVPPEFEDRLFERFAQADSSATRAKGGTGLGLAISRAIIEKMGGVLRYQRADPERGESHSFYFLLPTLMSPKVLLPSLEVKRERLLICEDDPDIAAFLCATLADQGFEVTHVSDAMGAKEVLRNQSFDAMTLDLMLSDGDGINLLSDLRAEGFDIPVVVVSAYCEEGKVRGGALDVFDWLQKPVDVARVQGVLTRLTRNSDERARILHVEDDADVRQITRAVLGPKVDVREAASLEEARELLQREHFDLALLDIGLPDGDGLELVPILAQMSPPIPVALFSAQETEGVAGRHVAAALVKSRSNNATLRATIERLLSLELDALEVE